MKQLLILSGKGGTGKTTVAAALSKLSDAKAIADCDVDAPNLHLVLSVQGESRKSDFYGSNKARIQKERCISCGLCEENCRFDAVKFHNQKYIIDEIACEGCGVCSLVCPEKAIEFYKDVAGELELYKGNMDFSTAKLKMGRGNSGKLVTEVKFALYQETSKEFAIIDGSPGIGCPVIASVSGVDLVLVVAEPSLSGLSDLKRLYKTTSTFGTKIAVCVNKWDISEKMTDEIMIFCKENEIPIVGKIPYDKKVSQAINKYMSVIDIECEAKNAMIEIYKETMKLIYPIH